MPHESEGKALLCYHKSADGRCQHYGPACQTKVVQAAQTKPVKAVSAQLPAAIPKK
ncbi:MAG: hypothetical protein ACO1NO_11020 [Burkholderiaceae bacterium]